MTTSPCDTATAAAYPDFRDGTEACADADPELFFASQGTEGWTERRTQAIRICRHCPLTQPCLDWALRTHQEHGVYGGTTAGERRKIRKHTGGRA